jgi:SSS family solute:Na+ symporter
MMNSATTLLTMDVYKKYLNKTASDKQLVRFGRGSVFVMIFLTAGFALLTYDPASAGNFFLSVSSRGAYFTPGIVVVFFLGIIWKKSAPKAAVITMISAPFISLFFELGYNQFLAPIPAVAALFGTKLNFLHRVWFTFWGCALLQTVVSLYFNKRGGAHSHQHSTDTPVFAIDAKIAWTEIAIFSLAVLFSAIAVHLDIVPATAVCWFVGILTFSIFIYNYKKTTTEWSIGNLLTSDRFYAGLLSGLTVWILFYFV